MIWVDDAKFMREFIGGAYDEFWRFKGRYRVVKGSRASKKSKTTALWYISQLSKEKYREANLLVVRKTFRTLKDSCFAELKVGGNVESQGKPVGDCKCQNGTKDLFSRLG